jgi:hypothetical protein
VFAKNDRSALQRFGVTMQPSADRAEIVSPSQTATTWT